MYNIEYNKEMKKSGSLNNIKSIIIDTEDILMMKNIGLMHNGDRNLIILYLKYLKYTLLKRVKPTKFGIKNTFNNEKIINSIIECNWLINEKALEHDLAGYEKRKEYFQNEINILKDSNRSYDKRQCLLMQYFIDSLEKVKGYTKVK